MWRPWLARHVQKSETSIYWSYFEPDNNPDTYSTCQTKFAHGLMISFSGGACWYGYSVLAQEGPAASDNLFYPARNRENALLILQDVRGSSLCVVINLILLYTHIWVRQKSFKKISFFFWKIFEKFLNDFWRSTNTGVEYIHVDANT